MYVSPEENCEAVEKTIAKPQRVTTDDGRVFEIDFWSPRLVAGEQVTIVAILKAV